MIDIDDRTHFLAGIHLFRGLSEDELTFVAENLEEVHYPAEHAIIKQGELKDGFFLLYRGSVRVERLERKQKKHLIDLVSGDYFGEGGLASRQRRSASIISQEPVVLLKISRSKFEELVKKFPKIKVNFNVSFSSRRLIQRLKFKWVEPDEVIYFLARKHPVLLIQGLVAPITLAILYLLAFLFFQKILAQVPFLLDGMNIIAFLAIAGRVLWVVIDWRNDYYIVTNQRVVWLEKVVGLYDSRQEAPLNSILSVGVETLMIGRALDYGNVIVRTFVGKIPFNYVSHPYQAAAIVEEFWRRSQEVSRREDIDAVKEALREKLDPTKKKKKVRPLAPEKKTLPSPYKPSLLMILSSDIFRLRFEEKGTITYRRNIFVLFKQTALSFTLIVLDIIGIALRLYQLQLISDQQLVTNSNGIIGIDTVFLILIIIMVVFLFPWWLYQYLDWSNDFFQVTNNQILDVDRKPLGSEQRSTASLDSILSTRAERIGFLGYIFNYGNVYISVGSNELVFEDVHDPVAVQLDIDRRRIARNAQKKEKDNAAERDRLATWIATYHRDSDDLRQLLEEAAERDELEEGEIDDIDAYTE